MKKITIFFLVIASFACKTKHYLLVGTYTDTGSKGIYTYRFNPADASAMLTDSTETSNPSYLTPSPNGKYVYAVNEDASSLQRTGGHISAFSFNKKKGKLKYTSSVSSKGDYPCYITTDDKGKWVITANYGSNGTSHHTGNYSVHPTGKKGEIMPAKSTRYWFGSGPNLPRQASAHAHCAVLSSDNRMLYVADLGGDAIHCISFNYETGRTINGDSTFFEEDYKKTVEKAPPYPDYDVKTSPGSGPRHLVFHPNNQYAYLVLELNASVNVYKNTDNKLTEIQNISALPLTYNGEANSADIHVSPDGNFLYVSNRGGSNTISIFKIDEKDGTLTIVGHQYTMGKKPRNFNFDPSGKYLLVANQDSDEIVIFKRDVKTGLLTDTGKRIAVPKPVCLQWISQ